MACPICRAPAKPRSDNPAFPFCGTRCKAVDLGKWLLEEYRIPFEDDAADEAGYDLGQRSTPTN